MKKIEQLTMIEYLNLVCAMTESEEQSRRYCKRHNIDFEEVKESDWGLSWQVGCVGVY